MSFHNRENCPACSGSHSKQLLSLPYSDPVIKTYLKTFYGAHIEDDLATLDAEMYVLEECQDCKLVYQKFIPNESTLKVLYDKWIDPTFAFETDQRKHTVDWSIRDMVEIVNVIKFLRVPNYQLQFLDFGMGWSKWCFKARALGGNVEGCELSEERILFARKNGIEVVSLFSLAPERYDFINTEQVFEHLDNPLDVITLLAKSLKLGGILKINVPNGNGIVNRISKLDWSSPKGSTNSVNPVAPLEHINCYNRQSLNSLGRKVGLTPIDIPHDYDLQFLPFTSGGMMDTGIQVLRGVKGVIARRQHIQQMKQSTRIFFRKEANLFT